MSAPAVEAAIENALAAIDSGRELSALDQVDRALAGVPGEARLWQVKALLHRALDDLEPALAAFDKAAAGAPRDAAIAHGRAHAALEAGLPALDLFEAALALAPADNAVRIGLSSAQMAEQGLDAAIERLDRELAAQPRWMEGHWLAGRLRWMNGERDHFTASLVRLLNDAPRDIDLWRQLLLMLVHAGRHDQALATIGRGRQVVGDDPVFDVNEAACLTELGRLDDAERRFQKLPRTADQGPIIYYLRHLLRAGRPQQAADLALSIASKPDGQAALPYLALAWRVLGDPGWQWLEGDPRLVGVYDLDDLGPLDEMAAYLRGLHRARGQPLDQSVRGGTQTDGKLFTRIAPEARRLRAAVVAAVRRHVAQLPPIDQGHPLLAVQRRGRIRFNGSWSVRLQGAGHHVAHVHPAGWFSSALYVALPEPDQLGPAPSGWLALGEPPAELGLGLDPIRLVEPKPGRLALFPSTMWHGTRPFAAGERLTVAFDVGAPV